MLLPPAASVNVRQHSDNLTLTPPPLYATVTQAFRTPVRRLQADVTSERLFAEFEFAFRTLNNPELLCMRAQVRLQPAWKQT
jgi:hypothetical protein